MKYVIRVFFFFLLATQANAEAKITEIKGEAAAFKASAQTEVQRKELELEEKYEVRHHAIPRINISPTPSSR